MIDPNDVPTVADGEALARFVFQRSHIRPRNQTLKPDAFMPPANLELSVTRHLSTTEEELWAIGEAVGISSNRILLGRGDILTSVCRQRTLTVQPAPVPSNPNHAHIMGWPPLKPEQKNIAQEIAARAMYVAKP